MNLLNKTSDIRTRPEQVKIISSRQNKSFWVFILIYLIAKSINAYYVP